MPSNFSLQACSKIVGPSPFRVIALAVLTVLAVISVVLETRRKDDPGPSAPSSLERNG
jgi:hypothetical protein